MIRPMQRTKTNTDFQMRFFKTISALYGANNAVLGRRTAPVPKGSQARSRRQSAPPKGLARARARRWLFPVAVCVAVAGCSAPKIPFLGDDESKKLLGEIGFVPGFLGGVVADDPEAAVVGRDILSAGGAAADAAVATYFTLAVTKPTAAGLMGGGICVIHDSSTQRTETLAFPSMMPGRPAGGGAAGTVPIPGNPRGFAVLHARYGVLKWGELLQPAENLARFGFRVSRAFAADLGAYSKKIAGSPDLASMFSTVDRKRVLREGDQLTRLGLSGVLGRLRVRGVGDLYQGSLARDIIEGARPLGGKLTRDDLRNYRPSTRPTLSVPWIERTNIHLPTEWPGGALAAQLAGILSAGDILKKAPRQARPNVFLEASRLALGEQGRWLADDGTITAPAYSLVDDDRFKALAEMIDPERRIPDTALPTPPMRLSENDSATGFVVLDRTGSAVACTVSMNQPFGGGRAIRSLGLAIPTAPGDGELPAISRTPLIVVGNKGRQVFFIGTAAGGAGAAELLVDTLFRTGELDESVERVLADRRYFHSGVGDIVFHERGLDADVAGRLKRLGHRLAPVDMTTRINVIYCETGVPSKSQVCATRPDPRGFGLGVSSD